MHRFLTVSILFTLMVSAEAGAQVRILNPEDYTFPVRNVSGLCSANFGEMRPDHFHSGVDIKTDGAEGKPIVAAADGYISRITITPSGYGRALYVTHPDGTMSVYGHLSRFRDDIDSLVLAKRCRTRRNDVDIRCGEGQFPVRRGDIIALSGNTGNSFGPHLHFEIRDTESNTTLNLIRQGIVRVEDNIPPRINAIYYIALDSAGIVPVRTAPRKIETVQNAEGRYIVAKPVDTAPRGYFVVDVTDRKNRVHNRFGIWRATMQVDGETTFEYRADGYRMEDARRCNAVAYYPMQIAAASEMIALAKNAGAPGYLYTALVNDGVTEIPAGETRHATITVEDDCGNVSTLDLNMRATLPAPVSTCDTLPVVDRSKPFEAVSGNVSVKIPAEALYESAHFICSPSERGVSVGSTALTTPLYDIMSSDIPLQQAATIAIKAYIPADLRERAGLALLNAKGRLVYAGGRWSNGAVEGRVSKLGTYGVAIDTLAPSISPRFSKGANMSRQSELSFRVSDDFSGIKEFSATIDGQWIPLDFLPIKGIVSHRFDHHRYGRNCEHIIVLSVSDNCGNKAVYTTTFFR